MRGIRESGVYEGSVMPVLMTNKPMLEVGFCRFLSVYILNFSFSGFWLYPGSVVPAPSALLSDHASMLSCAVTE